jgi:anti-sigma factor RsiW
MSTSSNCRHPARMLLPWAVTGRLEGDDALQVREHLASCAECRAELEVERRLVERLNADDNVEYAPAASLQKFMAMLDRAETERPSTTTSVPAPRRVVTPERSPRRWFGMRPLMLAVTAMQSAAIVLLGILVARPLLPAAYTTLAEPALLPGRPALHVMFAPELPVGELPTLLGRVGAQIVSGPGESGLYTLVLGSGRSVDAALSALRSDPRVRFAEPVPESRGTNPP